jgi:hypothetical protein
MAMVVDEAGHIIVGGSTVVTGPANPTGRAVIYQLDP